MKKLTSWLRRLFAWLADLRVAWICAGVAVAVILLSVAVPAPLADTLRYAGLALELLGVATVILGLRDRGRLFERPSLGAFLSSWFARKPAFHPQPIQVSASISEEVNVAASLSAVVWHAHNPADPPDARIAALAQNIETLRQELSTSQAKIHSDLAAVRESVTSERTARSEQISKINYRFAELGAGGLNIEMVGVIWLILGIVFATIPGEIADLLPTEK